MDLIKGTAIVYTTSSWSNNDNDLAAALNSSSSRSNYDKWGVTFEYNAAVQEAHSTWESISIPQNTDEWDCTLDGVSNGSSGVGVRYNTYIIDDDDFSNSYSGYEFKGIALYMDNWGSFTGNEDCWFLAKDGVQYEIGTVPSAGTGIMISPVYVKLTSPDQLLLQYTSPIVVNRDPSSSTVNHRIKSEDGYSGQEYCENQINFLELALNTDSGIYANNEDGTLEVGGEYQKVIRIPSNDYLYNKDYGMHIIPNDSDNMVISKYGGEQIIYLDDSWIHNETAGDTLEFKVSLNKESSDSFTEIEDTLSYKFLGICVIYTETEFKQNYILKEVSDKCFFIAKTHTDNEGNYKFNILCHSSSSKEDPGINKYGFLYVTPVFEAQREVYLTEPIIVKNFPSFTNITDLGNFGKDTSIPINSSGNIEFGYTDGVQNRSIFLSNFSGLGDHNEYFNPPVSVDAGFVELFGSWSGYVSGAWKQNMTSDRSFVKQTYLGWNQTSYDTDDQRPFTIHTTYINTAETDNNSLYLYIHGTCSDSNIASPSYSEGMTVQDYQAKCNGYEMIGFVVYFKEGAELDDIEKWGDPSDGSSYASYFTPILWDGSSFSAKIKIDLYGENKLNDIPFENYLAISPVYLKTDTKTITLGYAQDPADGDLSDYVSTYTVSVTVGDTTKQYSQGDSIEVSGGDTITITLASSESGEWYAYSEKFTIGGKTYSDGASIGYDNLEDGDEFHPIFDAVNGSTIVNDTARTITANNQTIDPWTSKTIPGDVADFSIENDNYSYDNVSVYSSISTEQAQKISCSPVLWMYIPQTPLSIFGMSFLNEELTVRTSQNSASMGVLTTKESSYKLSKYIDSLSKEAYKDLTLRGILPVDLTSVWSFTSNIKFRDLSFGCPHEITQVDTDYHKDGAVLWQTKSLREGETVNITYVDRAADMNVPESFGHYMNSNGTSCSINEGYVYGGDGVYNFVISGDDVNGTDNASYDYEVYNCGVLLGYIQEKDDDNKNVMIKNDSEFFMGITYPGLEAETIYGYDTVQSEQALFEKIDEDNGFVVQNIDKELESKVAASLSDKEIDNDYCTFQTGNQFVTFRLRNPYDGKVLNYDEDASYGKNNGYTQNSSIITTHEQPTFLTSWEQRSIFNALNGKATYVNEVSMYSEYSEKTLEANTTESTESSSDDGGDLNSDMKGIVDHDCEWYKNYINGAYGIDGVTKPGQTGYEADPNISFIICEKNKRKAGRQLVDNIDDWFQYFKREEEVGVIAGGNTEYAGGSPLVFVGPLLNEDYGCCLTSDAVRSNMVLGPGESITIPIVCLYKVYEEDGRDEANYSLGFDIRNNLYDSPLYYEVEFSAKYSQSISDAVSSQKANINSNTNYNVTVR